MFQHSPSAGPVTRRFASGSVDRMRRAALACRDAATGGLVPAAVFMGLAGIGSVAMAQEWPQRPSRIIVPFTAGGNTDSIARIAGAWLGSRLGQTVLVENRPGASGSIASDLVARAPADGYTMLMGTPTQLAIYPAMAKVTYDPVRDFAPMSIVGINPYALGVHPSLPVKSLQDLVALAKAQPGAIPYASAGSGAGTHLTMALFLARAGVQMNHIPYKGGSVAVGELVGGQVAAYFGNLAEIVPQARSGRVRALAVSGAKRSAQLPAVPTVGEQGFTGFEAYTWNGLLAPAKTPPAVVNRVAAEIAAAVKDPEVVKRLQAIGVDPLGNTPAEFSKMLAGAIKEYADAVKLTGARVD